MKCPNCGHWNRASFPRCFRCGTPLIPEDEQTQEQKAAPQVTPSGKVYIQINEEGKATSSIDERDKLAREMKDLVARKHKGEEEQQRLRADSVQQGIAPTGRTVQTLTGRMPFPRAQRTSYSTDEEEVEGNVRPDAIPVISQRTIEYDEYDDEPLPPAPGHRRASKAAMRQIRKRHFGARRFLRVFLLILLIGAVGFGGYQFLYKPFVLDQQGPSLQESTIITASILNDLPAHTIKIPGEEGQVIWITELKTTYPVVGGYATLEVADYEWYKNSKSVTQETVDVSLTPYLKTSAGEQKPMGKITYQVDIPLSPLELINPSSTYQEVSTATFPLKFRVDKNSTVFINGEDQSDVVNTENGLITITASVAPIGANEFTIVTRSQFYRENSVTVTLYREPQEIRLDLAADIATRWTPELIDDTSKPKGEDGKYPQKEMAMIVRGTTVTWANIRVLSPHANLDTTRLALDGSFSFEPVFDKFGNNEIIIEASAPGRKTSVVKHNVYYVPISAIYTRKAWPMHRDYIDYLNNSERRIADAQIYLCSGVLTEIVSEKPQMAVMKLNDTDGRTVLLRNYSNDDWVVGREYRIYADAYGIYNGTPWLNGRYTYPPVR